jgi:hypothetical protein
MTGTTSTEPASLTGGFRACRLQDARGGLTLHASFKFWRQAWDLWR